jgi:endonuclease/exonuclease/phosphatase family metal-dependent hydrolase
MLRRFLGASAAAGLMVAGLAAIATFATNTFATAATAPGATSGAFSALSYNVAGLPERLSSAPTPRQEATRALGQRLGRYNIVHVQEDFNYHAALYSADTHPNRTPTSGGAAFGSGLNSLSDLPYDTGSFERVRWDSCQKDSGDCLTPKGFTFMRVRLAEGAFADFYNLHTNAGTTPGDESSRASNLAQLTAFIGTHSAGNAVVVMGDTNTRYTRSADTIAKFVADNGLTDAWVQLVRGGAAPAAGSTDLLCDQAAITNACEVVDKIFYRSSPALRLTATSYQNEHGGFLDAAGAMLSDHDPITAGFSWTQNPDSPVASRNPDSPVAS